MLPYVENWVTLGAGFAAGRPWLPPSTTPAPLRRSKLFHFWCMWAASGEVIDPLGAGAAGVAQDQASDRG